MVNEKRMPEVKLRHFAFLMNIKIDTFGYSLNTQINQHGKL